MDNTSNYQNRCYPVGGIHMSLKSVIACFLVISFLSMSAIPINAAASQTTAAVLIDFGNGNAFWADVPVGAGMNAFNLTTEATTSLNLPINYTNSAYGIMVNSIGSAVGQWPHEYWHLWLWNSTTSSWMMSNMGVGDVNASSYAAFAWSYVQDRADYSAPLPQSTPTNRYSWEQSRHDNLNTGFNNITTSISNDTVWLTNLNNGKIDPDIVVSGSNIFIVTEGIYNYTSYAYDKSPKLYCLNQNGSVVWYANMSGGGWQLAAPIVVGNQVIVPSTDGTVYSFNVLNGASLWNYSVPFSWTGITSSPIVYREQIIIASGDGNVTALALNGSKIWNTKIATLGVYFSAPAAKDGIIYVGSDDSKLLAVNADGSGIAWNITVPGKVRSSPLLLDDEIVITYATYNGLVAIDGGVAAYSYTGAPIWNVTINSTSSSPALTSKGIVVTSVTGVTMVSFNGSVLWTKNLGIVKSSPSVSKSGIYLVTYGSPAVAYMLDLNGTVLFNKTLLPAAYAMSSPAIANGKVYLASDNGYIYCLENLPPTFVGTLNSQFLNVAFVATITSAEPVTVTWDFGDGNISTGMEVNHTYAMAGNYTWKAWAVDAQGGNTSTGNQVVSVTAAPVTTGGDDKGADNTTLYIVVALVAIVLVAVVVIVFTRSRKK